MGSVSATKTATKCSIPFVFNVCLWITYPVHQWPCSGFHISRPVVCRCGAGAAAGCCCFLLLVLLLPLPLSLLLLACWLCCCRIMMMLHGTPGNNAEQHRHAVIIIITSIAPHMAQDLANSSNRRMSPVSAAFMAAKYLVRATPGLTRSVEPQVNAARPSFIKRRSAMRRLCLPLPFGNG